MVESNGLDPAEAFKAAVASIGSQGGMADLIGMTQSAISKIISAGKWCPHDDGAVLKVEAATGISRHDLRPDLYPSDSAPSRAREGTGLETAR